MAGRGPYSSSGPALVFIGWRVYQERETVVGNDVAGLRKDLAQARSRVEALSMPANRPKLVIEKWGPVESRGVIRADMGAGFYIVNHGGPALEVKLRSFFVEGEKWLGETVTSLESNQKHFMQVWSEKSSATARKTNLLDAVRSAASRPERQLPEYKVAVSLEYRDFDNIAYRSTAEMRFVKTKDNLEFSSPYQERVGFSA
jgi:hypothetical protein